MIRAKCGNCGKEVWYPSESEKVPVGFLPTHRDGYVFCDHHCGRQAITKGIVSGIDTYPFSSRQ